MRFSNALGGRSKGEWAVRATLIIAVLCVGYIVSTRSLAGVIIASNPVQARWLAPNDGRITARLAESLFVNKPAGDTDSEAARLSRLALRQDPTAVSAVVTLGMQAQLRGDSREAGRLFAYSQTLSRRDLQTQLWAVENSVARGDIAGAIRHYDTALRTSKSASEVMFPVLAGAIAEPDIRASLAKTLAQKPVWTEKFVTYLTANDTDPRASALLFAELRRARVNVPAEADASVVNGLISVGSVVDAWRYYATTRPGSRKDQSRDPRFTANISTPSPFDWTVSSDANLTASILRGVNGGVFDFAVPTNMSGTLLQQTQLFEPGIYRLEGHSIEIQQPASTSPYWVLRCSDGRELGHITVPNSAQAAGAFNGSFIVPSGCPVQILALVARPSDAIEGTAGQIDQVRLFRAY